MVSRSDLTSCPECGAEFPAGRLACPECGSDAETGWKDEDEVQYQSVDLPDEGTQGAPQELSRSWFLVAAILAFLAMLVFLFLR